VPHGEIYRFGDAELDFTRCELRRGGKSIELSALEFKLLSAFVKRSGRLMTREQLLDEVWGRGTNVTDRVVDNQVNNLRKKIEPEPYRPRYLVALRGLGYRFDGDGVTER
jgi:two-component system alkaline phosphatase synthesis response regulator PhoP